MQVLRLAVLVGIVAPLAACSPAKPPAPPVQLYQVMSSVVAPQAQVIWDVSNRGVNDEGDPDASKLTTADWTALADAATALRDASASIEKAEAIQVVQPGQKILNEGQGNASTGAQVQALIDADRAGFTKATADLTRLAEVMVAAAGAKDAKKYIDAAGEMDQVCEACHVKFWYPQEVAASPAQ